MAALIGISGWRTEPGADGVQTATQASYVRAVAKAGAVPVVIPELDPDDVGALLDRLDGVVLVGGPDVNPAAYGGKPDPRTQPASPGRDAFDFALARACVERDHPLLAVCRGVQVLNVSLGGTLIQHLEEHMVKEKYNDTVHEVVLDPSSRVAKVVGSERVATNSLHHQAIDALGRDVMVVGRAEDGTVEAIEVTGAPRVMGVQWHPELIRHRREHLALFAAIADG